MLLNKYFAILILTFICFSCKKTIEETKPNSSGKDSIIVTDNSKKEQKKYLQERELIDYTSKAPLISVKPKLNVPFDKLQFNKVIAYDFEGIEEPYGSIIKNGHYVPVVIKQQYLNEKQIVFLLNTFSDTSTYGESTFACFNPHLGIVFYNNNEIVNVIDVCLDCNYLISRNIEIPATEFHKVNPGTEDEYGRNGFSNKGKQNIKTFCKTIGFHYGSIY